VIVRDLPVTAGVLGAGWAGGEISKVTSRRDSSDGFHHPATPIFTSPPSTRPHVSCKHKATCKFQHGQVERKTFRFFFLSKFHILFPHFYRSYGFVNSNGSDVSSNVVIQIYLCLIRIKPLVMVKIQLAKPAFILNYYASTILPKRLS
jgi:hypothetical protein